MAVSSAATETKNEPNDADDDDAGYSKNEPLFQKRIEFQPKTQSFTDEDIPLQTLNPDSIIPFSSMGKNQIQNQNGDYLLELDPELSFRITFRKIGAGLENLGNTCFINSVLQCLTYTEPFAAYLQSGKHKTSCRVAGFCAMCAIQNHVSCALQSTGRILAPKDLVKNIRCISRNFRNARQEDAHEYMVSLLESIHKCCLPTGLPSESPSAYEKSLVHKIFGGLLRSQVKCSECSYGSKKFDPFLDLSLEIAKADSLLKALEHFTAVEELDGGEKQYQCQQCKKRVMAVRQLTIHKAPYVLTIHLKRFGSTITGQKIDKNVHFGPTLNLKPFVSGTYEGDLNYTLYGVLVHAGWSSHSGHYYCFVRTSSGMWYALDDNEVFHVKERTVLEQKAYMLFYVRDRRNPTPVRPADQAYKRPADFVQNDNSVENKEYSVTLLGCRETIQNDMLTITSNTPAFAPMFTSVAPVTSASIQKSPLKSSYFFKPKGALMDGSAVSADSVESSLRMINLVQQSTHIHIREESLSHADPSAIDVGGDIPHSCTKSTDAKSELLEYEEAKPTKQIMDECLPQNAYSIVNNGTFILYPNGPKPRAITEHSECMQGTVAMLPDCVVSEELDSKPSTKDMKHKTDAVKKMVTSKALCESLPQTDIEGCVDVADVKAMNEQGKATATSNHFTAEVQRHISYSVIQGRQINSHPTDPLSKAINCPEKSIVALPACNVSQEVRSKAFATVENNEVSSKALSESLPEITSDVKGGETSAGTENKVINELEEFKSADHHIESQVMTQIASSFVKDGDCIFQHTGVTIKTISEHEKTMKGIAVTIDMLSECNVLQEYASKTSATAVEHKDVSVNELAPDMAVCKVGELEPEVVSSVQLVGETCAEEILHKVCGLGPVKVPCQLTIEEDLCKGVADVKPEEIGSVVFSSGSGTEETLCEGVNDIDPVEVKLIQLSKQLGTEEVLSKQVNDLEPGEVGTQFSSSSGTEGTSCIRVHGLGPEETDSTRLSNQVGTALRCRRIADMQPGDVGLRPLTSQQGAEGGQNCGSSNGRESSDLYIAEENGPKPEEYKSVYTLTQSSMTNGHDQKEALDNLHCQKLLKPKKCRIKFQSLSMNPRSSLLLRASLQIRRKKKHKRSRKRSLEYNKSTQKGFVEKSKSGLEPSTSEDTWRIPFDSSFSQRLQGNSGIDSQQGAEGGQNCGSSNGRESSDLYITEENGPKPEEYKSVYTLTQSSMTNGRDQKEALDNLHCQKLLKPKKCRIKFQALSMNPRSSLLLRASLRIRRKKKHKRCRKCSLEYDKSTQKGFVEKSKSGLEPSTSEDTWRIPFDSSFSQRPQGNSGIDKNRRQHKLKHDKPTQKVLGKDSISGLEPSTSEENQRIPFDLSRSQRRQGNSSVNQKRSKRKLEHGKSTQNVCGEESVSGLEQSTSEETRPVAFDSAHIQRKKLGNSSAIKRHTRELAKDVVDSYGKSAAKRLQTELKERMDHTGAIPANKEAPMQRPRPTLTANSCESNESHGWQNQRSSVNDFMNMLTRGLEETTVARWTNIGDSQWSATIGSSNRPRISIGYVPDEWDVEYDRGKRKKVKSKKSGLGSSNPFQEFATPRNRLKKAKLDKSSSENLPFRI